MFHGRENGIWLARGSREWRLIVMRGKVLCYLAAGCLRVRFVRS